MATDPAAITINHIHVTFNYFAIAKDSTNVI